MRTRMVGGLAFILALTPTSALSAAPTAPAPTDLEEIMVYLGFNRDDLGKLMDGKVISTRLKEGSDKELAVSVALLVRATVDEVAEMARSGKTFEVGRDVLAYHHISPGPPTEGDLAGLGYSAAETSEVSKLLKVRAGSVFNLSAAEIDRLQEIGRQHKGKNPRQDPAVGEAVNAGVRSILLERYRAYREGGLAAIAPYHRGGKTKAEPAKELSLAFKEDAVLPDSLKAIERAFGSFPQEGADDIENHFFWIKQKVQNRPTFILTHRMLQQRADGMLLGAERQFYVGQSYNSLQIVVGCVPVEQGTIMFYRNRTSTDQVAGFGSGLKHGIGRGQMADTIVKDFKALRKVLEKKSGTGE